MLYVIIEHKRVRTDSKEYIKITITTLIYLYNTALLINIIEWSSIRPVLLICNAIVM